VRVGSYKRALVVAGSLLVALAIVLFAIRSYSPDRSRTVPNGIVSVEQSREDFIKAYWQRPIPPQGEPPASFSELETRLNPEACAGCHPQQYADWKESLHSKAMGPGPWGQVVELSRSSPDEAVMCMTCHAPLSEQLPWLSPAADGAGAKQTKNPAYDPKLQLQGITCAACHVRQHQRFGPPKAEGTTAPTYPAGIGNHGGVERTPYFEKAEFCRDCHQFDAATGTRVNGKPLQDTFREWQNSSWGKSGTTCQQCHMPGRRHLWRGIHDAEWVRGAVRFEAKIHQRPAGSEPALRIAVDVVNAAVGHNFPSYVTPKVFIRGALLDGSGKTIPATEQERVIGWDARFEDGKWQERFDTRIAPGQKFTAQFEWASPAGAKKVRVWVEVHPDHFYHHEFYPAYLKDDSLSPEGRKLIEKARIDSGRTPYILFEKVVTLD
jgi:hypothetical protein